MSVTSPPICRPQPAPAVQTADGALQPPSRVRAITRPLPTRACVQAKLGHSWLVEIRAQAAA